MIIFKNVDETVKTSMSIDEGANLKNVVDAFIKFLRCAGYECDARSIKDLLED